VHWGQARSIRDVEPGRRQFELIAARKVHRLQPRADLG
jgi:hypothetical protein